MDKSASLTPALLAVIQRKATEKPFTGVYDQNHQPGTYLCRQCGLALFRGDSKFSSQCGWPSFDKDISANVKEECDADGRRIEILCTRCNAHLGHVFRGEGFTAQNTRYCVNSASLDFVSDVKVQDTAEAIFAGGCFWGVESLLQKLPGVLKTEVGYTGGKKSEPTYEEVCRGNTGHLEAVRVIYDPEKLSFYNLAKYFFEIHDPSQQMGQGPDQGEQYQSAIFYYSDEQQQTAKELIQKLQQKGFFVSTQVLPVTLFWPAEDYHQDYYAKHHKAPYCHFYTKRFE